MPHAINVLAAYPTGNEQGIYFNIATSKPISPKKATNLPILLDFPDRIHTLAGNESEDFVILDNHDNPFVGSDNLFGDSSVDIDNVEVETVDDDDDSSSDSEDDSNDDDSSDNESEKLRS